MFMDPSANNRPIYSVPTSFRFGLLGRNESQKPNKVVVAQKYHKECIMMGDRLSSISKGQKASKRLFAAAATSSIHHDP